MKTIIYSKEDCPYCVKAKKALVEMNITYQEVMLNDNNDKTAMINAILDEEGVVVSTVPQIYINGEFIGGHDDLMAWRERQELKVEFTDLTDMIL